MEVALLTPLLVFALSVGCGGAPMDQLVPVSRYRGYARSIDTLGSAAPMMASAAKVWDAVPAALTELGLELSYRSPGERRVGTCNQRVRGRLAGEVLSSFLDCGETRNSPNADRFEIALTVLVTVRPTSEQTSAVHVFVLGVGADASGSAAERLWCHSKGMLEEKLRGAIETKLGT